MPGFDFERLDVYAAALDFIATARALKLRLPPGNGDLGDQLTRAATSVVLNIAEGTGEYARSEKGRFYRIARRSAFESAAVLDIMRRLDLADETELRSGRSLLDRIGAMLTRMIVSLDRAHTGFVRESDAEEEASGSGSGGGSGSEDDSDAPALD